MRTISRPVNPYPPPLNLLSNDGEETPYSNEGWDIWERCQKEMDEYYQEALQDPIGLLMSAEGELSRMKDMAQGDLWSGLDQTLALIRDAKGQIGKAVNEEEG